jgi:hypothetical protein
MNLSFHIQKKLQNFVDENLSQYDKKYAIDFNCLIECSCGKKDASTKKHFSDSQAKYIFFNIYKFNDTRCIICKINCIYFTSDYPIITKKGDERKTFQLDHMIPFSKDGNNCLRDNIIPICPMCNSTKSDLLDYVPFSIAYLIAESEYNYCLEYYQSKTTNMDENMAELLKSSCKKSLQTESEIINYLKTNKEYLAMNYSNFIIYELTEIAKIHQLRLLRKYFVENIGVEPNYDLVYSNGNFYLSSYSTNQRYLYRNSNIEQKYFTVINTLLRLNNNPNIQMHHDELYEELFRIAQNNIILYLTDFLAGSYCYDKNMIDVVITTIKYIYEVINEFNSKSQHKINFVNNLSYSHFFTNQMTQNNIYDQLNYCREKFIFNFNYEPYNDILNTNGFLTSNIQIKQINFPIPDFLTGDINYDYYGKYK